MKRRLQEAPREPVRDDPEDAGDAVRRVSPARGAEDPPPCLIGPEAVPRWGTRGLLEWERGRALLGHSIAGLR